MGVHARTLYTRRSPAFVMARLAYEPLTAPLIVTRDRLVAAPFRAIDMLNWSVDGYDDERAEQVLALRDEDIR